MPRSEITPGPPAFRQFFGVRIGKPV